MTYYLKYRPQKIEDLDLVGVRESLAKIVKSQNIPHALLFSGPKGTGKTSAARILAKVINCEKRRKNSLEPCNKCSQCKSITYGSNIDVIELDAASHRGIDDVRTLRDAVKLASAKAEKKIYIIDEAHMLTTEASNAFLKTLEEPPEHVVFILATTNPEKLIGTIRSRVTNVVFTKASEEEIVHSLQKVVKGEKLKIKEDALKQIAKDSDGSFRDATKIIEQLVAEKVKLEAEPIKEYLSRVVSDNLEIFELLSQRKLKESLEWIEKNALNGVDMRTLIESIVEVLRKSLLAKSGIGEDELNLFEKKELIDLIDLFQKAYVQTQTSVLPQIPIELTIVNWCEDNAPSTDGVKKKPENDAVDTHLQEFSQLKNGKSSIKIKTNRSSEVSKDTWASILSAIRPINSSTEALLRAARPINFDGSTLTLGVFYSFHKEHLETIQHMRTLERVAAEVMGSPVRVRCMLTEAEKQTNNLEKTKSREKEIVLSEEKDDELVKAAKEIFG